MSTSLPSQIKGHSDRVGQMRRSVLDSALFVTPRPDVSDSRAIEILKTVYGVTASVSRLSSERDANFLVVADDHKYVLKIANEAEPISQIDCNTAALSHISKVAPDLQVPRLVRSLNGALQVSVDFGGAQPNQVRLFDYLSGQPLAIGDDRLPYEALGAFLGKLDAALSSFYHPDMEFEIIWDSSRVGQLTALAEYIPDETLRRTVETHLVAFERFTKPRLANMRRQIIHNDVNPGNTLTDDEMQTSILGLIDFGDIIYAPVVNELAVTCAYHFYDEAVAAKSVNGLSAGYCKHFALTDGEIDVFPDLVIARFLTTILVTHWRASLFEDNREYILRNNASARHGLELLVSMDPLAVTDVLRKNNSQEI